MDRCSFGDEQEESPLRSASPSRAREEEEQEEEYGYSSREMLLYGGCSDVTIRLRLEDALIERRK